MTILTTTDNQVEAPLAIDAGDWDQPYTSLIFIAIHWNGDDFSFLNKLENRYGFKWDRWSAFKKHLRPMTFHCFKVEGYKTKTSASGSGFRPVEHVAEFAGIDQARLFNRMYMERWHQFHDSDEQTITRETNDFCNRLASFTKEVLSAYSEVVFEQSTDYFANELTKEQIEFAMKVATQPDLDWSTIIDTGDIAEMYGELFE